MTTVLPRSLAALAGAAVVLAVAAGVGSTASSNVSSSRAGRAVRSIDANTLKPAACSAITMNGILTGSGMFTDSNQPHLVLGSSGVDTIRGGAGNDCILGGGGNDSLRGDGGTDVCIGGLGIDTFHASCETQIQ